MLLSIQKNIFLSLFILFILILIKNIKILAKFSIKLELNKIVSGSVSASILSDGTFRVNGDTYIDGTITAKELRIDYVTSSVLFTSGSNKFGNTPDDSHQFTGSVLVSGSINLVGVWYKERRFVN